MVCANEPIQTTDNTSGLTRRRLTIEFNRSLWDKNSEAVEMIKLENGEVNGLWKSYLPGLVNWVLEMDTKKMREYLLEIISSFKEISKRQFIFNYDQDSNVRKITKSIEIVARLMSKSPHLWSC